ncbi:MAG: glycosyltransferase family 4 protein [Candidatus Korarchaeota archaeon]
MNVNAVAKIVNNVVAFIPYPYRGGLQEYAIELSRRLGIPLVVVVSGNKSLQTEMEELFKTFGRNLHVFYADFDVFRNPILVNSSKYNELRKVLKEFELVHFHGPFPLSGDLVLRELNYIFTYHFDIELRSMLANTVARLYGSIMLRNTLKKAKVITATSETFVRESRFLNEFRDKVAILPLGIDARGMRPTYEYLSRIVFIGRIIPEKGIHVLLYAFKKLVNEHRNLELFIIGKPVDTSYYNSLKALAKSKGIEGKVHFTGYLERNKMLQLLASSSALVLPSLTRLDSFGIVILEASSLAVPVVVSSIIPGAREFVERAGNGFLVRPSSVDDLVASIRTILRDPREFGERGRRYVIANHDWDTVVGRALDILNRCTFN